MPEHRIPQRSLHGRAASSSDVDLRRAHGGRRKPCGDTHGIGSVTATGTHRAPGRRGGGLLHADGFHDCSTPALGSSVGAGRNCDAPETGVNWRAELPAGIGIALALWTGVTMGQPIRLLLQLLEALR